MAVQNTNNSQSIPPVYTPPAPPPVVKPQGIEQPQANQPPSQAGVGFPGFVATPKPKRGIFVKLLFFLIPLILITSFVFYLIFTKKISLPGLETPFGEKTIRWWGLWEDESVILPLIAEYEEKNPNIKIKYLKQSKEDYRVRLDRSLSKGEGPDIFRIHNTWVPMFASYLDPLPSSVMSATEYSQTFYPVITRDMTLGRDLVGIPLGFDTLAMFINLDIFESFAKSPPTTWDELKETAQQLTIKDKEGNILSSGLAMGFTQNVDHWQEILALLMLQNGVKMSKPVGEDAENALKYFTYFATVNKTWDSTLPPSTFMFANGKLAILFAPSWRAFEIDQINPKLRYKVYPVPQIPKDNPGEADVTYASYWVEGVWKQSKVKTEAWNFLKFLTSKESLQKLYENESKLRRFGEPYPRVDMASLISSDPIAGAFVSQGNKAQSWYLASRTFDGDTGINTRINKYFEDAVNSVVAGTSPSAALQTASLGVSQVLADYGLIMAPPTKK